jgi:hypothetical protein
MNTWCEPRTRFKTQPAFSNWRMSSALRMVCIIHTQTRFAMEEAPGRVPRAILYLITCIVSQTAASAGFCTPSISTLTS